MKYDIDTEKPGWDPLAKIRWLLIGELDKNTVLYGFFLGVATFNLLMVVLKVILG